MTPHSIMLSPAGSGSAQHLLISYFLFSLLPAARAAAASENRPPISFGFDFTSRGSYKVPEDLEFEGNVSSHNSHIDLTCSSRDEAINGCVGRMSYAHPVPIYDTATREVASFATQFTFAIKLTDKNNKGDGMAFFLACYPSSMPPGSMGGNLGLKSGDPITPALGENRFVAVEFDTFNNTNFDPMTYDHIGIDASSMKSLNTTSLPDFSLNAAMTASITFDNTTRMLVASLYFDNDNSLSPMQVSAELQDPFSMLTPEVVVGFSASTGSSVELHQIMSWSFNSTLAAPPKPGRQKQWIITGVCVGALLVLPIMWCIISWFMWINRRERNTLEMGAGGPKRFDYRDLAAATDSFSEQNKLGQGAFGLVYRGRSLKGLHSDVAVKKILNSPMERQTDFFMELNTVNETKHKNLVKLIGWCYKANSWNVVDFLCWCRSKKNVELFLVYELVSNRDLYYHLHNREAPVLPWTTRYKIVKGIGAALLYLHEECHPYILHRDIKPSNILLDADFNAKLADFGLSRIANSDNLTLMTTAVGSEGYLDPQCRKMGKVEFNRSSDIYSFGVVLLEIACKEGISREQIWHHYREKTDVQTADHRLNGEFDFSQMERVIVLGLWCSHPENTKRPTIAEAMNFLEYGKPLPDLNLSNTSHSTIQHTRDVIDNDSDLQALMSVGSCSSIK